MSSAIINTQQIVFQVPPTDNDDVRSLLKEAVLLFSQAKLKLRRARAKSEAPKAHAAIGRLVEVSDMASRSTEFLISSGGGAL